MGVKLLTSHFGKMIIKQQETYGNIGVGRSFVHRNYYYEQISSYIFCFRFITSYSEQCTNFIKDVTAEIL